MIFIARFVFICFKNDLVTKIVVITIVVVACYFLYRSFSLQCTGRITKLFFESKRKMR